MENTILHNKLSTDSLSQLIEDADLQCFTNGLVCVNDKRIITEDRGHCYRLIYILKGQLELRFHDKVRLYSENTILFLSPDIMGDMVENEEVQVFYLGFEIQNLSCLEDFEKFIEGTFPDYCVKDSNSELRNLFEKAYQEGHDKAFGSHLFIQLLFKLILLTMVRFSSQKVPAITSYTRSTNRTDDYYNSALHYIQSHITDKIEVSELASYLGISEIYLYKLFKKHSGESPQQFIMRYKIHRATRYLSNPNIPIKTISDMLGFNSLSHFSSSFKKYTNETPGSYRKRINTYQKEVQF